MLCLYWIDNKFLLNLKSKFTTTLIRASFNIAVGCFAAYFLLFKNAPERSNYSWMVGAPYQIFLFVFVRLAFSNINNKKTIYSMPAWSINNLACSTGTSIDYKFEFAICSRAMNLVCFKFWLLQIFFGLLIHQINVTDV